MKCYTLERYVVTRRDTSAVLQCDGIQCSAKMRWDTRGKSRALKPQAHESVLVRVIQSGIFA